MDAEFLEKHYPEMDSVLQERVLARMRAMNLKASPLAKKAGLGDSFVRDILRGKTSVPKADNLDRLAQALETTPDYLLGKDGAAVTGPVPIASSGPLPFGGRVSAGYFLSIDEFNQDLENFFVPDSVPRHPGYPQLPQTAWLVQGDSMDQAGIMDGMWAVAASYPDYIDIIGELGNGTYVIVERARAGGSELERTVKEVQFGRKGMRLIPRSSNPVYREFFIDLDPDADSDTEQVRILGVVLWVGRDLDPRSRS